jgi:hypothetical protein
METRTEGQHQRCGMTYYIIADRDGNIWNGRHFVGGNPKVLAKRPTPETIKSVGLGYGLGPLSVREVALLFIDGEPWPPTSSQSSEAPSPQS